MSTTPLADKKLSKLKKKIEILEDMLEVKTRSLFTAKQEVDKNSNFIKAVIESMSEIVLSIESSGQLKLANNAAKIKLRLKEDIESNNIRDILDDEIVDKLVKDEGIFEHVESLINGRDQIFPGLISRRPFKKSGDEQDSYVYSIVDITTLKERDKLIEKQRLQLVQNAQLASLGEVASGIAHEINNPVTIIDGQLRRLRDYLSDDEIGLDQENLLLEKIQQNLTRIVSIVSGIRKISRVGENDNITAIKILDIFNALRNLCKEKFKNSNVNISFQKVGVEHFVMAKETQVLQILMNLISNSSDALSGLKGSWISLHSEIENNMCRIRVIDSGKGIESDLLKKIFNPFFTTKDIGKGTGIGLSISRQMIEELNGELYYELFKGNTSFVICLHKVSIPS